MKAQDVMGRCVATVPVDASLADAARLMWDASCGFIPVVQVGTQRLCGVLTDRDVCMGALTQGVPLAQIPVVRSMSHRLAVCRPDDSLGDVEAVMRERRVRRVVVIGKDDLVVGVISLDDLARVALETDAGDLRDGVARTLGLVSQLEPARALAKLCAHKEPREVDRCMTT